ncbi:MAG TPA: hypothetical protein VHT91_40040 [Kofleriaceae bacterium]|jgi:hypothetical protein|nr:hypothetical protein [Kofleriaceae bacterium]
MFRRIVPVALFAAIAAAGCYGSAGYATDGYYGGYAPYDYSGYSYGYPYDYSGYPDYRYRPYYDGFYRGRYLRYDHYHGHPYHSRSVHPGTWSYRGAPIHRGAPSHAAPSHGGPHHGAPAHAPHGHG